MTQKLYVLDQSKPKQRRNAIHVALHMLQRTTCEDGKPMISEPVLHLVRELLIAGVNSVPSIEILQNTIRLAKNVAEYLNEPIIVILKSKFLVDSGEAQTSKLENPTLARTQKPRKSNGRHLERGLSVKKSLNNQLLVYGTIFKSISVLQRRFKSDC
jgi:hypothetical protein